MANDKRKGFASLAPERLAEIASKGGRAAKESGNAHRWSKAEATAAGHSGGAKTAARGPEYMGKIGKKGGEVVSSDRAHMADLGRRGAKSKASSKGPGR